MSLTAEQANLPILPRSELGEIQAQMLIDAGGTLQDTHSEVLARMALVNRSGQTQVDTSYGHEQLLIFDGMSGEGITNFRYNLDDRFGNDGVDCEAYRLGISNPGWDYNHTRQRLVAGENNEVVRLQEVESDDRDEEEHWIDGQEVVPAKEAILGMLKGARSSAAPGNWPSPNEARDRERYSNYPVVGKNWGNPKPLLALGAVNPLFGSVMKTSGEVLQGTPEWAAATLDVRLNIGKNIYGRETSYIQLWARGESGIDANFRLEAHQLAEVAFISAALKVFRPRVKDQPAVHVTDTIWQQGEDLQRRRTTRIDSVDSVEESTVRKPASLGTISAMAQVVKIVAENVA